MPWLEAVPALLESYLGGQAAGHAIVDVLLGDANPSGKLAETFPCAQEDCASDPYFPGHPRQVEYREGLFVGYRYFDTAARDVLFPFGHGLSYTSFAYEHPRLIDDATTLDMDLDDAEVAVSVEVVNTGEREGAEVVQLYVHRPDSPVVRPQQELRAFAKVSLQPGERKEVSFRLTRRAFALYDVGTSAWQVEPGLAELRFASSSRDIRQTLTLSLASSFVAKSEAVDDVYRAFGEGGEGLSDESFSALLGRPLPVPRIPDPLTRNSTLDDARDTWLGRMLFRMTHWGAQRMLRSSGQAEFLEALETGLAETPLRSLVQLGGGRFRFRHLDAMIHMMNGQWWRGIRVLFGAKSG
jgi:beta-glucosidase